MPVEGSEGGPPQMRSANHINRPGKDPDKKSLASIRVIRGQLFFSPIRVIRVIRGCLLIPGRESL